MPCFYQLTLALALSCPGFSAFRALRPFLALFLRPFRHLALSPFALRHATKIELSHGTVSIG